MDAVIWFISGALAAAVAHQLWLNYRMWKHKKYVQSLPVPQSNFKLVTVADEKSGTVTAYWKFNADFYRTTVDNNGNPNFDEAEKIDFMEVSADELPFLWEISAQLN